MICSLGLNPAVFQSSYLRRSGQSGPKGTWSPSKRPEWKVDASNTAWDIHGEFGEENLRNAMENLLCPFCSTATKPNGAIGFVVSLERTLAGCLRSIFFEKSSASSVPKYKGQSRPKAARCSFHVSRLSSRLRNIQSLA